MSSSAAAPSAETRAKALATLEKILSSKDKAVLLEQGATQSMPVLLCCAVSWLVLCLICLKNVMVYCVRVRCSHAYSRYLS